jgi:hypothetical protein
MQMSADFNTSDFIKLANHPLKFRLFLLSKLPSAFFSGVRLREMNENKCMVTVPYKWFSRNPFRSTYFACLAMAGEMSTGALGMAYVYKRKPAVSMLVVSVRAEYQKKATGKTTFICEDGSLFRRMIDEAITTGEARTVTARSIGRNTEGEIVADIVVTWSFKMKKQKTL